jgi:hypothetical protein
MPDSVPRPRDSGFLGSPNRRLWLVLSLMALAGMASIAVTVWSFSLAITGRNWLLALPLVALGLFGTVVTLLFTMGLVYRVDRRRGDLQRRVEWFE